LTSRVNARARTREDRAGDPLDGLVNLFDLGIVLAVAFLLAALSSIDLAPSVLKQNDAQQTGAVSVPADSVIQKPGEEANTIELQPGEEVVGQGEPVGTVYKLSDGRTVIVRPDSTSPVPGEEVPEGSGSSGSDSSGSTAPTPESTPSPNGSSGSGSDSSSSPPADSLTAPQPSTGAP
jgi:hypothetical protein